MASNFQSFAMFSLYFTILAIFLSHPVAAVPEADLESMLAVMRSRGYNLFSNAVITSDLYSDILEGKSFTLFAPTDASLFALDMTASADVYTAALRRHVVPRRLSVADIRRLPSGFTLPTLFPRHEVRVQRRPASDVFSVDDVDVVVPGLFYGRDIAVHGLGGILDSTSHVDLDRHRSPQHLANLSHAPYPPENISDNHGDHHHAPSPLANFSDHGVSEPPNAEGTENRTVVSPSLDPVSLDRFSQAESPEKADLLLGDTWIVAGEFKCSDHGAACYATINRRRLESDAAVSHVGGCDGGSMAVGSRNP